MCCSLSCSWVFRLQTTAALPQQQPRKTPLPLLPFPPLSSLLLSSLPPSSPSSTSFGLSQQIWPPPPLMKDDYPAAKGEEEEEGEEGIREMVKKEAWRSREMEAQTPSVCSLNTAINSRRPVCTHAGMISLAGFIKGVREPMKNHMMGFCPFFSHRGHFDRSQ